MRIQNTKLLEMAFKRSSVVEKINDYSDIVGDHILKCVVYGNSLGCIEHWFSEIATFFEKIGKMEVKGSVKLKPSEYKTCLFDTYAEIGNKNDYDQELFHFKVKQVAGGDYPDFDITDNVIERLCNATKELCNVVCSMIASIKIRYSVREYKEVVKNIIFNYCV